MNALAKLDQLNLDADTKIQIQMLFEQSQKEIHSQQLKIQALTMELAYLRRNLFGKKSESLSAHSDLFEETLQTDLAAVHAEIEQLDPSAKADPAKSTRSRAGRQPLPEHLPRIEHRHEPESCQCDQCGQNLVKIGEDVSEQLDVEPAKFFVHRHIRPQYACKTCENVTAAPIPPAIIEGGMAAPGLLSWVLTSKYLNHLPLYRLEQIAVREQVTLSRSTLAEWVGRGGVALQPLADRLTWHLLQGNTLHADETPVAQLDPGKGKTRKAYLWAYRSNDLEPGPLGRASSCSTIKSVAVAGMRKASWKIGEVICWSTTMVATKPCSLESRQTHILNWLVGHTHGVNSSICTRLIAA